MRFDARLDAPIARLNAGTQRLHVTAAGLHARRLRDAARRREKCDDANCEKNLQHFSSPDRMTKRLGFSWTTGQQEAGQDNDATVLKKSG
jgi:hypothetical protein